MCNGFPCKCCKPVKSFDTHFDEAKPWKCFFQDMQEEHPTDTTQIDALAPGLINVEFMSAFLQDYRFRGARPIQKACADSCYTPPTFAFPSAPTRLLAKALMARMQYGRPESAPDEEQRTTITFSYSDPVDYPTLMILLGDEHDDATQSYSTLYVAWPRIRLQLDGGTGGAATLSFYEQEGSNVGPNWGGYKAPGTYAFNSTPPIPKTGSIVFTIERRVGSTRCKLTVNGLAIYFTVGGSPSSATEWASIPSANFRESPHWRLLVAGKRQSGFNRVPTKIDRLAVLTEPL